MGADAFVAAVSIIYEMNNAIVALHVTYLIFCLLIAEQLFMIMEKSTLIFIPN